ncbi:unnamed protein product [Lactuca saligna]|uniref:Uncharacterized protein n=1 Tax=Lactuca saligna TaxID=75948 RepID=A0AA36EMS8_LACSI|nr:unnamed protein product [Lactuca saligna]
MMSLHRRFSFSKRSDTSLMNTTFMLFRENTIVESRVGDSRWGGGGSCGRHVVESSESAVWIFRVNVVSMATGTERRKQKARVWTSGSSPGSSNLDVAARSIDAMHVAIKAFSKMDFMSYLHLVELGLTDLH